MADLINPFFDNAHKRYGVQAYVVLGYRDSAGKMRILKSVIQILWTHYLILLILDKRRNPLSAKKVIFRLMIGKKPVGTGTIDTFEGSSVSSDEASSLY